jgi:DNA invertase Pin-like site-specific DNA recombinase
MRQPCPPEIKPHHLQRLAIPYCRQSTQSQVDNNPGSTEHQRSQEQRAIDLGWRPEMVQPNEEDLGVSGRTIQKRQGLRKLIEQVAQRQVGIILVSDFSRLTRSVRDFEDLLALCRTTDTLIAVEGTILNLNDSTHRLMARYRVNFAEFDNDARTENFMKSKRALARRGDAVSRPPTGYVRGLGRAWDKDPDRQVRETIEEVLRALQQQGAVSATLRYCHDHGLTMPTRDTHGNLSWSRPSFGRIYHIATNPTYAGYYVYGRNLHWRVPEGKRYRLVWDKGIVVPNHHEPYIHPAEWHKLQERLHANSSGCWVTSNPRVALCTGLIWCGACGRRMASQYYASRGGQEFHYHCSYARRCFGEPLCWRVPGRLVDSLVEGELLRHLVAPEIEDVIAAGKDMNQGYEAALRQRGAELARAEYESGRLGEQLKRVDPDNTLVFRTLETDWQHALERLDEVRNRHAQTPITPALTLSAEDLDVVRSLAADVPALWHAPSTSVQQRRELVRLFIPEIRISASTDIDFEVELKWVGGIVSRHRVFRLQAASILAKRLKQEGRTNAEIFDELARLDLKTINTRRPYSRAAVVCAVRGILRPWRVRSEELRGTLAEVTSRTTNDREVADEFDRLGVEGYEPRAPWTEEKVKALRRRLRMPPGRR